MRVALSDVLRIGQGESVEQILRFLLRLRHRQGAVDARAFDHLRHQRFRRVEGGRGALRDVGDFAAVQSRKLPTRKGGTFGVSPKRTCRRRCGSQHAHNP